MNRSLKKTNDLAEMENLFLALSDKTRLKILNLMRDQEVCVNSLAEVLGESQPKISRHLAYLKTAGIVFARREGKWIYYKIAVTGNPFAENILRDTLEWLVDQEDLRENYSMLRKLNKSFQSVETTGEKLPQDIFASGDMKEYVRDELETFLL